MTGMITSQYIHCKTLGAERHELAFQQRLSAPARVDLRGLETPVTDQA